MYREIKNEFSKFWSIETSLNTAYPTIESSFPNTFIKSIFVNVLDGIIKFGT